MKKLLQDFLAPVCLFLFGLLLLGCDQSAPPTANSSHDQTQDTPPAELKSGNMLYVIRDIADVQLKAGTYIEQLQQAQQNIQRAIDMKDQTQLQASAQDLKEQLTNFNDSLNKLNLKSQEINDIRQNVINTNQQVLNSSFLNGQLDLSKADFQKIEQQIGSVQSEMLKLAKILVQKNNSDTSSS